MEPDLPQLAIELYETLLVATRNQNVKKALPIRYQGKRYPLSAGPPFSAITIIYMLNR